MHTCIRVDDIIAYCDYLVSLDLTIDLWPSNWSEKFIDVKKMAFITDPDGYEVVQLDVEPDDFYIGKTFLVHNKGSNSEPTYPSTKFSNQAGDFFISIEPGICLLYTSPSPRD